MIGNLIPLPGFEFSTDETFTGLYWTDGKPIMAKVFSFTAQSTQGITVYNTNVTADSIIACWNEFRQTITEWTYRYVAPTTGMDFISCEVDPGNLLVLASKHSNDLWNGAAIKCTILYTKP